MNKIDSIFNEFSCFFSESDLNLIEQARKTVSQVAPSTPSQRPKGMDVAAVLMKMNVDIDTILAAILSDPVFNDRRPDFNCSEHFGNTVAALVQDVNGLNRLKVYSKEMTDQPAQTEILRRMLLSVVKDARAVLIKLAFRIQRLRSLAGEDEEVRHFIAQETLDIYAPIANRLGVNQLKWELEDMAFRHLQPKTYSKLVKSLAETRRQRESRIDSFIGTLKAMLDREGIEADIAGRPKHLFSILKKMQRKQLEIDELYDLLAIRVIVEKLTNCYAVLGLVHDYWKYIPKEFDDYIANPKSNGYQSLHTVVLDSQGHRIEVQIRTRAMHEFAELGVAAHWRYKEGGKYSEAIDKNIAALRKLLEDKDEEQFLDGFKTELYYDRVYVLTPAGKLIDLVKGATVLDFAYAIHTEIGHRCRGAKVNGRIVPLSYRVQTGEQVEILTVKEGEPNQQWIDPNLGYLQSARAIAKVKSRIKQLNFKSNLVTGRKIVDKLAVQMGQKSLDLAGLAGNFKVDDENKLLAAIGHGDITTGQLKSFLKSVGPLTSRGQSGHVVGRRQAVVLVDGHRNVKTSLACCCKPVFGDKIIGFITHHHGIKIHREVCENIMCLSRQKRTQLIEVTWAKDAD